MKKEFIVLGLFIIVSLIVILMPNIGNDYIMNSKLYINEVMASNKNTILDDKNEYSDYIEIYNGYNYDINLEDYYISDSEFDTKKWKFPNITIKSKEYLIVYASNLDTCDLNNRVCHTNFNLSSKGEVVTLVDKNGNIISKITYPKLGPNLSYGYVKRKYIVTDEPTPNAENSSSKYKEEKNKISSLRINEYMTHNNRSHYDEYGNYYDWVELYNNGDKDISLKNVYISDNKDDLTKFRLPDTVLKQDEYIIVYFSKDVSKKDTGIYANFGLSDDDENIIISDGENIIDIVDVVKLYDDVSYGVKDKKWQYFLNATPGRENTTASFETLGGNNGNT